MKIDPLLVLEKINQGLSDKEIAKLLDCSEKAVADIREGGISRGLVRKKSPGPPVPKMDGEARAKRRQEIAAAVDAGEAPNVVASRFGVSPATVKNSMQMYGKTRKQEHKHLTQPEVLAVAAMLLEGQRDAEIGEKVGLGRERIRLIRSDCEKAGLFAILKALIKSAIEAANKLS